jgi:hypothetical protein
MTTTAGRPLTRAEQSGYRETSRHEDVVAFVDELEACRDARLVVTSFGTSLEGRALPLLVLSSPGVGTPEEARATGHPVVLVINGIHAGEVEGKEASLMLARDLLSGPAGELLDRVVLLVVPLFNPDGNDRIDPANRKLDIEKLTGQIGPEAGAGTRANASGINLNRDYMKQAAPEMRLLQSRVCRPWAPHLTIDCHATNGSVHRFALTYDIPHTMESGRREPILYMREKLLPAVTARLRARTGVETFYYGNFVADEGGSGEGWITYPHHPRFGSNYRGLTGRLDLLLETYSYLTFHDRVFTTYEFLVEVLTYAADSGRDIVQVVESSQRPPDRIAVRYRLEAFPDPVEILTRRPRTLTGEPVSVRIPHLARFTGAVVVDRPWGYVVPEAVAMHLAQHGVAVRRLDRDRSADLEVATVERTGSEGSRRILEASARGERDIEVAWSRRPRPLPAGTYVVATGQPLGAVATYLCEAESDDGVLACQIVPEPGPGAEFPVQRLLEPVP